MARPHCGTPIVRFGPQMMDAIVGEERVGGGGRGASFCSLYITIYTEFVKSNGILAIIQVQAYKRERMGWKDFSK